MNYAYATLLLDESGEEINKQNLTAVFEASGTAVEASRVKAIVAALEDIDLEEIGSTPIDGGLTDPAGDGSAEPPADRSGSVSGGEDVAAPMTDEDAEAPGTRAEEES